MNIKNNSINTKLSILFFLFTCNSLFAQFKISGIVLNEAKLPVEFAEVLIFRNDTVFYKNELTNEEGRFEIELEKNTYKIRIIQLSQELYTTDFTIENNYDFGIINVSIKTNQLDEIVLVERKRRIERKIDRLVFNVENTIGASGSDVVELLKITPGIKVQNDNITMIGKSGMKVLINDRLVLLSGDELTNYLRTISSDNIAKIEVISTPPAKYEASGNSGLINIVLKRNKKDSWNASFGSTLRQRSYLSESIQGDFGYNKDKWNIATSLNYGNTAKTNTDKNKTFYENELWLNKSPRKIDYDFLNAKIAADYQISSKWSAGFQYLGSFSVMDINGKSLTSRIDNTSQNINSFIKSKSKANDDSAINSVNLHSEMFLDTIGKKINIDLDYFKYGSDNKRDYDGAFLNNEAESISNSYFAGKNTNNNTIKNYALKMDVELPLKWTSLNFGGKLSSSKTNNALAFYSNETGVPVLDENQSNKFNYEEDIQALYFSANKKIGDKWATQFGLRMEATQTKGYSFNLNQVNENNYIKFFPTAYISYEINENKMVSLNFSKRINRPNYEQLNPFKLIESPFLTVEGNPFLQPSFTNNFELSYTYKKLDSKIFFSKTTNGFEQIGIVNPTTNITNFFVLNYFKTNGFGISESYVLDISERWSSINTFNFGYSKTTSSIAITQQQNKGINTSISTSNDFLLNTKKTLLVNLNYYLDFPGTYGLSTYTSSSSLNLSLKYSILDQKLQFTLSGNDIFRTEKVLVTAFSNNIKQQYNNYYDQQSIRFSVLYKFGNSTIRKKERELGNEDELNRAKN